MVSGPIKPPISISVGGIVFVLILVSLHLMTSATQDSTGLGEMYSWLFIINILGSVLLLALVAANITALVGQVRKRKAGAQVTLRMVVIFIFLSMAPASIVFYYSMQFIEQSIDSWFDVQIDRAMEDALELSQAALDQRMAGLLKETIRMAHQIGDTPDSIAAVRLGALQEETKAMELVLISKSGRIIAYNSRLAETIVPSLPEGGSLMHLSSGQDYVGLESVGDEELQVRTVVSVRGLEPRYLLAIYPLPARIRVLTRTVESAHGRYKEMNYLRSSLKTSFSLTLSLVLLLSLLGAIWIAFVSIRNLVAPVKNLAIGTLAVTEGDYGKRLPVLSHDEWGFLAESFNEMTDRLAETRDEAGRSRLEVETQHAYLETILGSLTSGVLSFDTRLCLRTANQAAEKILDMELEQIAGKRLKTLIPKYPRVTDFVLVVQQKLESSQLVWQAEVAILGRKGRQEVLCRGMPLYGPTGKVDGSVMVFDDMTDLIKAERNAAWGEVAQRLAHEIKNPLTPIQLSAERLQRKLKERLNPDDSAILERATNTIVQQVEAMKSMVNAFSDYARPSRQKTVLLDLNHLIEEVLLLYSFQSSVLVESRLEQGMSQVEADPVRMRQVLHNLFKNATEAMVSTPDAKIVVSTSQRVEQGSVGIELRVEDNGPGISVDRVDRVFDPYVTDKTKGTGLGLAIVKKIIEEHGGIITVDLDCGVGTAFVVRLPVLPVVDTASTQNQENANG